MKKTFLLILFVISCLAACRQAKESGFPVLKGPYLGQKLPGITPEIFAPGIISVDAAKYTTITFSSSGDELYFYRWDGSDAKILYCKVVNGNWTFPEEVSFTAGYKPMEPLITVDNKRIYFIWDKPVPAGEQETIFKIWFTERTASGWSEPQYAGQGMFVSTDREGNLYVTDMSSITVDGKTYLSKVKTSNGRFSSYEKQYIQPYYGVQAHPCIAPDGTYIIFDIDSGRHLFVSFKKSDGTWDTGIDLANHGFDVMAGGASITPDGKYLFFSCKGQLMWVDTIIIQELKPKEQEKPK